MKVDFQPGKKTRDVTVFTFSEVEVMRALRNIISESGAMVAGGSDGVILYPDPTDYDQCCDVKLRIEHDE